MLAEIIRIVIEAVLGGTLIVTLVTLRSTKKKASEEARGLEIDNNKRLMDGFNEYIVEPLKKEVNGLRIEVRQLKRAIEKINDCPHAADCPVRHELQNYPTEPICNQGAADRAEN
ncbi:MAG: hypothetical protein MJZ84_07540 [Paludibacteraceae bacterium]|nr:hypothetical protein [Paludibacteraceae bacterium]